jgi:hypothetical protein
MATQILQDASNCLCSPAHLLCAAPLRSTCCWGVAPCAHVGCVSEINPSTWCMLDSKGSRFAVRMVAPLFDNMSCAKGALLGPAHVTWVLTPFLSHVYALRNWHELCCWHMARHRCRYQAHCGFWTQASGQCTAVWFWSALGTYVWLYHRFKHQHNPWQLLRSPLHAKGVLMIESEAGLLVYSGLQC